MSDYIYKPPKSLSRGSTVIAYLRDSGGPKQELSIGQQGKEITEFCHKHGLILQRLYSDTASGRKTKKRDDFILMFNDVMTAHEDLRPSGLLLWSFSRFSRDVADFHYYLYGLIRQGLIVHSLTEEIPEGLAGGVLLSVKAYSNADFSEQLSKNIKRGIADRVKEGYNNGGQPPRGYKIVREYQESRRANGARRVGIRWEPDPDLAPLVVLAWELRAQGQGYGEITKATGGKIYKNKTSWGSHFRNKSYLGIGKAGDMEVPDHHTPIITWELWHAVKKVEKTMPSFGGRAALTHPRRIKHPSLLSGLSFCIYCGDAMVLHTSSDYRSYQCGKRDRQRGIKDCTQARSVNARKADRVILDTVLGRILSPTYIETLLGEIQSQMVDTSQIDRNIGTENKLLTTTERSITRLLSLAEETGDIQEIAKRLKDLRQERDEISARITILKAERDIDIPEITPETLGMIFSTWRAEIEKAIGKGDILAAKRLMAQFVSKIDLGRDKAIIHYTFPLGIPCDGGKPLSAHKSPAKAGFFFSETLVFANILCISDSRIVIIFQYSGICDIFIKTSYNVVTPFIFGERHHVSIRFKVILPYLLLTLLVAVTGAYVVTRLVASSLEERLANQLLEAGRVVSDSMARQEIDQLNSARIVAYTRDFGRALKDGDEEQVILLAKPAAGGLNVESLIVYDSQGREALHVVKQSNGTILDATQHDRQATLSIVDELLVESDPNSPPRRVLATDPVDDRYYYLTSIPVMHEDQVVGAVVVGTSLNTLVPQLESISASDVIFYEDSGMAIASTLGASTTDPLFLRTFKIEKNFYSDVINQDDSVEGENFEVEGRVYRNGFSPLKIGDDRIAVFAVVLPMQFVVESSTLNRNNYVFLYSAAMIAVILVGYLIARIIINPLSSLVRTSRAIADGDLAKRTGIKTNDEIGVLANTFDDMTEHLQQRTLELEKTNQILEQMDRTKIRFIQVSAHELRTPLTLVQGYAQMVQMKAKGNPNFEKYANGIMDGTTRMVDIIDNLLDASRIDSNLLDVMKTEVEIEALVERAQKAFTDSLQERKISFSADGLSDLPTIGADKELLYKVFYHVIMNAIKYTPDGGAITIHGHAINEKNGNSEVELSIKDTGIGIDPQYHELVFEKFYQTGEVLLHSSGKTKFKGGGPGLGLAISRGIMEAHHGRIWLESPGHDEITNPGTTVFIRLPVDGQQ